MLLSVLKSPAPLGVWWRQLASGSGRSLCGRQGPCDGHATLLSASGSSLAHSAQIVLLLPTKGLPRIEQRNIRLLCRPASVPGCSEGTLSSVSEVPCSWPFSVEGGSWLRKEGSDRMAQVPICGSGGHCRKQHLNHCPLFRVWLSWQASAGSASCHHAAVAEFWGWSN